MARFKAPKQALSLPNEHSITLRALHNSGADLEIYFWVGRVN